MEVSEIIIANTDKDFNEIFRASAFIAKFITASDYERYSIKDEKLTDQIKELTFRKFGDIDEEFVCISDDWWPDHTRGLECSTDAFSHEYYELLRGLLIGDYSE